jgi:uncharacterized protein (TIGR02246 family)
MTDEEQVRNLVESWMEATSQNNLDHVLSLIDDGAVFLVANQPPMSKETFATNSRKMIQQHLEIKGWSNIQEISVSGDLAYCWNNLTLKIKKPGESIPIERRGPVLTVFRKRDGQWRLLRDANLLSPVS